jgi:xylan 1,4-beta-xylosidase
MNLEAPLRRPVPVFAILHHLGDTRLATNAESTLVTRRKDGTLVLALWNYGPPDGTGAGYTPPGPPGPSKAFVVNFKGLRAGASAKIWRVDSDHGNVVRTFDAMGRPAFPSREKLAKLRGAAKLGAPANFVLSGGNLKLEVPAHGLAIVEIR